MCEIAEFHLSEPISVRRAFPLALMNRDGIMAAEA
jgi:hypothetical protein